MLKELNSSRFERRDIEPRKQDFNRASNLLADFWYCRLEAFRSGQDRITGYYDGKDKYLLILILGEYLDRYLPITRALQRLYISDLMMIMVMTMIIQMIIIIGNKSKSFRKSLSNKCGTHGIMELQKTATLGTEHILKKVFM